MATDPMSQFKIKKIFDIPPILGQDISFTNASLWMMIAAIGIIAFFTITARGKPVSYTHLTLPTTPYV